MASNSQLVYIFAVEQRETISNFCESNETEHEQTDALLRQMHERRPNAELRGYKSK